MRALCVIALLALAACGVEGPPVSPAATTDTPGINISGEARIGVVSRL